MLATKEAYLDLSRSLAKESGISAELHGYFEQHRDRLWSTICRLDLLARRCGHVLDIGPYFAYTPFFWKQFVADRVSVFEGADPDVMALEPLYRARGIDIRFGDLFRVFDEASPGEKRLPYEDNAFDAVTCWETMEHFNFNPVPFVRELHRISKPGGSVCITVPNVAKLDRRLKLLLGRGIGTPVEDYQRNAATRFFGFHWREYTLAEIASLFRRNDFTIELSCHLQTFENRPLTSTQKLKRVLAGLSTKLVPGFSALCVVKAKK